MPRYLLVFAFMMLFPAAAWSKTDVSFYVCAHPDDCLLFMNPPLYQDVTGSKKVVVIYLTSGDAGKEFREENSSYPHVRELASLEATDWMADIDHPEVTAQRKTDQVDINGHRIEQVSYGDNVSYFLRLPDGSMDGAGFPLYASQSLKKLKTGEIHEISPVDGQAPYKGWQDLVNVLSTIVNHESADADNISIHVSEPDIEANPGDHSDHTTGASAMVEALEHNEHCYHLYKHIGYSIADRQPNLQGAALQNKAAGFAVLTATQRRLLGYDNWEKGHLSYLPMNYYSVVSVPNGCI